MRTSFVSFEDFSPSFYISPSCPRVPLIGHTKKREQRDEPDIQRVSRGVQGWSEGAETREDGRTEVDR